MKLTQNKIDEVIFEILGKEGFRLVKELKNKENISEFTLATKLRKDIKIIRNMLYKLYNHNLVVSTRKKDKQKGWYIYYWTLLQDNLKFLYLKNKKILLQKLKDQLQKEQTEQFYTCKKRCVRSDFDQSLDLEFRCPECGELISLDQNWEIISSLKRNIAEIEKEIENEEKELKKPIKKKTKTTQKRRIKSQKKDKKIKKLRRPGQKKILKKAKPKSRRKKKKS